MKVCQLGLLAAALVVAGMISTSQAADGRPSDQTLAAMGLSDLQVISDSEGLAVRGLGWNGASAYGQSFAVVAVNGGAAGSTNGYKASGKKKAAGANFSIASVEVEHGGGHGGGGYGNQSYGGGGHGGGCNDGCGHSPKPIKITAFAGGSSFGSRK